MPFKLLNVRVSMEYGHFNTDEVQLQCLDGNPGVMKFDDNSLTCALQVWLE